MKIAGRTILCILLSGYCAISSSQTAGKHSVGLQLNPFFDEHLFNHESYSPVYAFRYTFGIKKHITFGPELSGFYTKTYTDDFTSGNFNAGAYIRYSFLPQSRLKPFLEASSYYTYHYWKNGPEINLDVNAEPNGSKSYLSGYVAPGITLSGKSGKISLDLMYKFSNKTFVNGGKSVFSYRLNFWF
ncbi:MAG: autotransporter domain-containing protein [Bacteroidales bacterium]|jgi:hypothetical protein|nr:autotransporter domain-containing protein [Bacteroidales bacterium]